MGKSSEEKARESARLEQRLAALEARVYQLTVQTLSTRCESKVYGKGAEAPKQCVLDRDHGPDHYWAEAGHGPSLAWTS